MLLTKSKGRKIPPQVGKRPKKYSHLERTGKVNRKPGVRLLSDPVRAVLHLPYLLFLGP